MSVARLLSATETLEAPRIFERSAKLSRGRISTERGLVSMDKRALYPGPRSTLRDVCAALGCPDPMPLEPFLSQACAVHFGADGDIGKCYLEFAPQDAPEPDLVFLALKWRGDAQRLNRYVAVSARPHADKAALVRRLVPDPVVADVMQRSLDLARDGDPDGQAVVLHVTEDGSARASVDISVADAKASLRDATEILLPLKAFHGCDLRPFLDEQANARFGHIAAGQASDGATFVTIYYGARAI